MQWAGWTRGPAEHNQHHELDSPMVFFVQALGTSIWGERRVGCCHGFLLLFLPEAATSNFDVCMCLSTKTALINLWEHVQLLSLTSTAAMCFLLLLLLPKAATSHVMYACVCQQRQLWLHVGASAAAITDKHCCGVFLAAAAPARGIPCDVCMCRSAQTALEASERCGNTRRVTTE